ncbi:MAG: protein kinase, partial [Planctomycetes bacterium]|nr:protein kinase [Planctomycetota bacterium]
MAFSAPNYDSDLRRPPATAGDGAPSTEAPTVVTRDVLAPEASAESIEAVERAATSDAHSVNDSPAAVEIEPPAAASSSVSTNVLSSPPSADAEAHPAGLTDQQTVISKHPPIADTRLEQPYTPHELGQALVGKRLAHFELEEFLGGGMGAVFRGRDVTLGRSVAVKVLPRGQDDDTLRRFKNEAQSAARLNHENIARVFYVGEENGWNFIIFEYVEGVNIRTLVERQGPLSLEAAINHTLQVAEALDHAYHRDVVHRDIKPSNLIVSNDGSTKLVDMGLARLHQVEASRNDLTASGVTLGTFDYISPEQARDPRTADVRSDIYSLGCTLYYMLTGRPPFPEGTVLQKLLDHQSRIPTDPRVFRPDLPESAVNVLNGML